MVSLRLQCGRSSQPSEERRRPLMACSKGKDEDLSCSRDQQDYKGNRNQNPNFENKSKRLLYRIRREAQVSGTFKKRNTFFICSNIDELMKVYQQKQLPNEDCPLGKPLRLWLKSCTTFWKFLNINMICNQFSDFVPFVNPSWCYSFINIFISPSLSTTSPTNQSQSRMKAIKSFSL